MNGFSEPPWAVLACSATLGAVFGLWIAIKNALAEKLAGDRAQADALVSAMHFTLIPMTLAGGVLVDVWGVRETLCLGSLLTAISLFALSASQTYRSCLRAVLLAGVGLSALNVASCVLMPRGLFENSPAASLNLGFVFVGLGAVLTPVIVPPLIRTAGFRRTLILAAVLCLAPAVAVLAMPAHHPVSAREIADFGNLLGNPLLWLAAAMFLCYGPIESWLGTAAPRYLEESGYPRGRVPLFLVQVWLLFLAGRWLTAYLLHQEVLGPVSDVWLLSILAVWAVIALGNLAGTHTEAGATWGLRFLAASLGPIFPTLIGIVFKLTDPQAHGMAFGVVFAAGTAGNLALAPLCRGGSQKRTALRAAPHLLAGIVLVVASTALALLLER
jgi:fucose permease